MKAALSFGFLVLCAALASAAPAAAATPAECEAQEAAARAEVAGHATEAETNEYARGIAAPCWEEVHSAERSAQEEQQISEEREREEAEERHHHPHNASVPHYERKPTVREGIAKEDALRLLHRRRDWRQRVYGDLDCRHGRINRYMWSCNVLWLPPHSHCWKGRVLVEGWRFRDGEAWFKTQFRARDVCTG